MICCARCDSPASDFERVKVESSFVATTVVRSEVLARQSVTLTICEACLQRVWDGWEQSLLPNAGSAW